MKNFSEVFQETYDICTTAHHNPIMQHISLLTCNLKFRSCCLYSVNLISYTRMYLCMHMYIYIIIYKLTVERHFRCKNCLHVQTVHSKRTFQCAPVQTRGRSPVKSPLLCLILHAPSLHSHVFALAPLSRSGAKIGGRVGEDGGANVAWRRAGSWWAVLDRAHSLHSSPCT